MSDLFDKDDDIKDKDTTSDETDTTESSTYYEEEKKADIDKDGVIEGSYIDITEVHKGENANGTKSSYYSETILNEDKPKKKLSSFKRFVAGILVASIIGGPMIGVGIGLAKPISEKFIVPMLAQKEKAEITFGNAGTKVSEISTKVENTSVSPASTVAKNVGPSVVGITSTISVTDFFNTARNTESSGSGIIFNQDKDKIYIVTNNHVIDGATTVVVTLSGNQKVQANFVGADSQTDLAVISVNKSDLTPESLNNIIVAKFGDSTQLQVGELAIAIGNPLGEQFSNSVTQGIISGLDRKISTTDKEYTVIQTDAAINNGNSGGALVNSNSEVIGINTIKLSVTGVEGMGFAIPTNIAKPIIEELMNKGYISRPALGIVMKGTITEQAAQIYGLPVGVIVSGVVQDSGAANAGIQQSDIITEFGGEKITSSEQLSQLIKQHQIGDKVVIKLVRNGKTPLEVTVVLQDSGKQSKQIIIQQSQNNQQYQQYYFGR